jgi:aryl-alcohol dehydrogenase-like predicted oxidoreductase
MKYIHPIGIGANIFGYSTTFKQTKDILAKCNYYGLNLIDTADVYSNNLSEEYIGKIINLKEFRGKFYISTKAGLLPGESADGKFTNNYLVDKVDASLKRLKTERIDFYLLHRFDKKNNLIEILNTLQNLSKIGKIRYFGFSNLNEKEYALIIKNKKEFKNLNYNQSLYNIFCEKNVPIIENCKKDNIFSTTYGSLLRGILTEKYLKNNVSKKSRLFKSDKVKKHLSIKMINFLKILKTEVEKFKMNIPQFAIYNAINNGSQSTIVGMRNLSQIKNICQNFDLKQLNNANKIRFLLDKKISNFKISYY